MCGDGFAEQSADEEDQRARRFGGYPIAQRWAWWRCSVFEIDRTEQVHAQRKQVEQQRQTFFRSVTHATDSTCTGCTAKIAAQSHAPGTFSSRSNRHSRIALIACSSDVRDVIRRRVQAEQLVLDPERRVHQRIPLRDRGWLEPDVEQSAQVAKRVVVDDVLRIVPDEARQ